MKAPLWSDLAIIDLQEIDDYLSAYSHDAAERALTRIEHAAAFLTTMPAAGPILRRADARKWRVSAIPYVLIYRVLNNCIEILRVQHGRQDWAD